MEAGGHHNTIYRQIGSDSRREEDSLVRANERLLTWYSDVEGRANRVDKVVKLFERLHLFVGGGEEVGGELVDAPGLLIGGLVRSLSWSLVNGGCGWQGCVCLLGIGLSLLLGSGGRSRGGGTSSAASWGRGGCAGWLICLAEESTSTCRCLCKVQRIVPMWCVSAGGAHCLTLLQTTQMGGKGVSDSNHEGRTRSDCGKDSVGSKLASCAQRLLTSERRAVVASRVANFIILVGLGLYSTLRFRMVSDYPASLILMKFIDLFLIFQSLKVTWLCSVV